MTARVTISLPDDLLVQLDLIAERDSLTRSDVVREAAGQYLAARASNSEAAVRLAAVEDGLDWLRGVAAGPTTDQRPSLEILREVRGDDACGTRGSSTDPAPGAGA